ncbi:putative RlpA-like domain superfamily, kiwellin [Helianthus annuus]|nr:putative RlpA-like domain superfamily, kiwellin [Helianthus annuus]
MRQFTVVFLVFTFLLTLIISCTNSQSTNTNAIMTINSFEKGGSGGGPSECDGQYHSDDTLIVALSTRWYNGGQRCFKNININYSGRTVQAMVVDECDSTRGCKDNIVDASKAVWKALAVPKSEWGETSVTWSDA